MAERSGDTAFERRSAYGNAKTAKAAENSKVKWVFSAHSVLQANIFAGREDFYHGWTRMEEADAN